MITFSFFHLNSVSYHKLHTAEIWWHNAVPSNVFPDVKRAYRILSSAAIQIVWESNKYSMQSIYYRSRVFCFHLQKKKKKEQTSSYLEPLAHEPFYAPKHNITKNKYVKVLHKTQSIIFMRAKDSPFDTKDLKEIFFEVTLSNVFPSLFYMCKNMMNITFWLMDFSCYIRLLAIS